MIVLGLILVLIGWLTSLSILTTIGLILVVLGLILTVLGGIGRPVAGRRTYW